MAGPRRLTALSAGPIESFSTLPDGPVAVALSGGADSAACAWAAVESGRRVRAIHVHHGFPASDMLRDAAEAVAERLGIPIAIRAVALEGAGSIETRARGARYRALGDELASGELLALGHTLDDQAETVLMNIVRGSGLDGMAGMRPVRGPIVRPLLGTTRSVTRELATLVGLPWRDDPANLDDRHLRNRVRREVLPMLESAFDPRVVTTLARTAEVARSELEVLDQLAASVPRERWADGVRFPVGHLRAVPVPVSVRAIRSALSELGLEHPPSGVQLGRVLDLLGAGGEVPIRRGLVARVNGPFLELTHATDTESLEAVTVTGSGSCRWGRFRLDFAVGPRPDVIPLSTMTCVVPVSEDPPTVTVRAVAADDRIGAVGRPKRVTDAMAEAGVPARERSVWPVVESAGKVIWVPGVRRVGSADSVTGRYLCGVATEDTSWTTSAS